MKRARLAPEAALPAREGLRPPWPGHAVLLEGRSTYVRHTPATAPGAEPAVYVHGLGGSSANWTDLADLLSDRLEGHALDLPGFGRSEPARRYTLAALGQRVVRVLEHLDAGPVHLFGNSLGGAVSVRVAATRPDLVRSLTLISPAVPFLDPRRSAQGRLVPMLLIPRVERIAARRLAGMSGEQLVRQVIEMCWADPEGVPPQRREEAVEEVSRRLAVPWYADAYIRTFRGLVTSFLRAYLPGAGSLWRLAEQITVPTLVVWGRQDRLVDVGLAPRVAGAIPDSRLMILDRVGHVAQMERPEVVARGVLGLLDEIREQGGDEPERRFACGSGMSGTGAGDEVGDVTGDVTGGEAGDTAGTGASGSGSAGTGVDVATGFRTILHRAVVPATGGGRTPGRAVPTDRRPADRSADQALDPAADT